MAQERIFTEEDRQWLKDNYPLLSNKKCQKHFDCGYEVLKKLVAECGMVYRNLSHDNTKPKAKHAWYDDEVCKGYCMDCKHYVQSCKCSKTGKEIGALWQKKCFT